MKTLLLALIIIFSAQLSFANLPSKVKLSGVIHLKQDYEYTLFAYYKKTENKKMKPKKDIIHIYTGTPQLKNLATGEIIQGEGAVYIFKKAGAFDKPWSIQLLIEQLLPNRKLKNSYIALGEEILDLETMNSVQVTNAVGAFQTHRHVYFPAPPGNGIDVDFWELLQQEDGAAKLFYEKL